MELLRPPWHGPFSDLAEELLVLIMEELRDGDGYPNLKNLRLAVRAYASLPKLLSTLFESIQLSCTQLQHSMLRHGDFSTLEPRIHSIRRVVFKIRDDGTPTSFGSDLYDGKLERSWTQLLKKLPRVDIIRIDAISDALFTVVLNSLREAQTEIASLHIGYMSDGFFQHGTDERFTGLKLATLHTLEWSPSFKPGLDDIRLLHGPQASATDLRKALEHCRQSVEKVTFGDTRIHMIDATTGLLRLLPKLQYPRIGSEAELHLSALGTFLRTRTPSLKQLTMDYVRMDLRYGSNYCRHIFDAIRLQPCRLQLEFARLSCYFDTEKVPLGNFRHFTGEASQQIRHKHDPVNDMYHSLAKYLSGTGRLDRMMRMWFDHDYDSGEGSGDEGAEESGP